MENKNIRNANINDLIILCCILNDYNDFNCELIDLMSSKNFSVDDLSLLLKSGKKYIVDTKTKKFVLKYKNIFDIINKYNSIFSFISNNYLINQKGKNRKSNLDYFYQYILDNKKDLDKILDVLNKIKELGFGKLQFYENLDFTTNEYKVDTFFWDNYDIAYLDNMEAIPNYQSDIVKYKTVGSNYKINGSPFATFLDNKKIILNSLVFNPDRLPDSITKESTFDKIIGLKKKKLDEYKAIQKHVDLRLNIESMISGFLSIDNLVNQIDDIENKDELFLLLTEIQLKLGKLNDISNNYDNNISKHYPSINSDILEKEKKLYLEGKRF